MKKQCLILLFCLINLSAVFSYDVKPQQANTLRLMSYNIRNAVGMDEKTDYERIASIILRVNPYAVAIQEIDSATARGGGDDVLREIADHCGMFKVYAPAIDYDGGKYGIGILAKEKPLSTRSIPLPGREEQRRLLIVEFRDFFFCCTHFSLTKEDRETSVAVILREIESIGKPLFLAGDLNARPESTTIEALKKRFTLLSNPEEVTFEIGDNVGCIDYIAGYKGYAPGYTVVQHQVLPEKIASDHYPLFVDVRIKSRTEDIFLTKPYLQNMTGESVSIFWQTKVPTLSWIEFGTSPENLEKRLHFFEGQALAYNKQHHFRVDQLKAGTTYYYRVCSREMTLYEAYKKDFGETAYSECYSFTIPPNTEPNFKALVFNDLHNNKPLMESLMKQVEKRGFDYDFVFYNGDCIEDPRNYDHALEYLSFINEQTRASEKPSYFIRGNHEIRGAYSAYMREIVDYGDRTYGSFNRGDTRFVYLDCGEDKPDSSPVYYGMNDFNQLRHEQATFLAKEIQGKAYKKAKKRVLLHHISIYGKQVDKYNPCREIWGDVLGRSKFNLCINGHVHKHSFIPQGEENNPFPIIIGGGKRHETATVILLEGTKEGIYASVLNAEGEVIQSQGF